MYTTPLYLNSFYTQNKKKCNKYIQLNKIIKKKKKTTKEKKKIKKERKKERRKKNIIIIIKNNNNYYYYIYKYCIYNKESIDRSTFLSLTLKNIERNGR